jgi:hypothetical protein
MTDEPNVLADIPLTRVAQPQVSDTSEHTRDSQDRP